ncbi:hypothetical protein ACEWY4_022509 [Coilia grayii]|uniref:G-protein coupled receptors family 1 profile domain-containing protein n=1 Tax=Coilia grayii TaxID=363190 RepID=A0ABD1J681_9TELE
MVVDEFNATADCFLPLNLSCSKLYTSTVVYVLLYVAATAVILLTVGGNLLVIISVCHFRQLHTPTNILILSLALSDFLVGIFVMPVHLFILIEPCILFGSTFCSLYNTVVFHLTLVSIYNVALIAVDRYSALSMPFIYSKRVSVCLAFIFTAHIWILSLLYNCALLYFSNYFINKCPGRCLPYLDDTWSTIDLAVAFIVPCAIIVITYLKVFFIARRHAVAIRATFKDKKRMHDQNNSDSMKSERKAARVLGILVSVFLVCLIPFNICTFLIDELGKSFDYVMNSMLTLLFLNSTINPIIYALFYPWFQYSIKLILTRRICRVDSSLINVLSRGS